MTAEMREMPQMVCEGLRPADLSFLPSGSRVARLDALVRHHLATSLQEAAGACRGVLTWREAELEALIRAIRSGAVRPDIMAHYVELVEAIFDDDIAGAQALLDELLTTDIHPGPGRRIRTIGGAQEVWATRYRRIISNDPDNEAVHLPFSPAELTPAVGRLLHAFDLIEIGVPHLAAELNLLLREVVLTHRLTALGYEPDVTGASSFYLWGAAFINFIELPKRLSMVEALTHEGAHLLLFGMTLGEPMVVNGLEERYDSPLREDKRPMDGLVHAAYVLARLAFCLQTLLRQGVLEADEVAVAHSQLALHRQGFASALKTIESYARFTPVGEVAFASAASWMAASCRMP